MSLQQDRTVYTYGDSVRARFVFIDFPSDVCDFSTMHVEDQEAVVEKVKWWFRNSTRNVQWFTQDSDIVFKPDDDFSNGTAEAWQADLPALQYVDWDNSQVHQQYDSQWASISSWWTASDSGLSRLNAEILYKIYDAWSEESQNSWPFGHGDGGSNVIDLLFMVYMSEHSPWDEGGSTGIVVDAESVLTFDLVTPDFFGNLARSGSGFQGTFQTHNSVDTDRHPEVWKVDSSAYVILHEFSHTFGWSDGPPNLAGIDSTDIRRYYYGYLNITSQHYVPRRGIPVVSLHNLAKMENDGWVDVVDFTGSNLKGERVYDIRYASQDTAGKIYRFSYNSNPPQEFLFAYHAGRGVDAQHADGDTVSLIRSRGLEVQHVVSGSVVDIESAYGMFHSIRSDTMPDIELPPPPTSWGRATPVGTWGFDNYDLWWVGDAIPDTLRKLVDCWDDPYFCWARGYSLYTGDVFDFFTSNTIEVEQQSWTAPEFSFRTNPSTFWYSDTGPNEEQYTGALYRFNYQNIPNSLYVRIREQHDSPAQGPPYMVVDFMSAPYETVLYPDNATLLAVDDTVTVRWTNMFSGFIDSVEVFFYPIADNEELYFRIGDSQIAPGDSTFTWVVNEEQGTDAGRLRVRFHNTFTDYVADEYSEPFEVDAPPVKRERIIAPDGGETLVAHAPFDLKWTNGWDGDITSVDLQISHDSGASWPTQVTGITYTHGDTNVYTWTSTTAMATDSMRVKLVFHSQGGNGEDVSDGDFIIVPVNARYVDVSDEHIYEAWAGQPAGVAPIDFDGDGLDDIVVSISTGGSEGSLLRNRSTQGGDLDFTNVTVNVLPNGILTQGFGSLEVADFDNDGDEDFFACRPGSSLSRLFVNTGGVFAIDTSVFAPADTTKLQYVNCATWVDFDHDSDLDLFLGRGNGTQGLASALFRWDSDAQSFANVATAFRLDGGQPPSTISSVAWADFDSDGLWEVVWTGSGFNDGFRFYQQAGDGLSFLPDNGELPSGLPWLWQAGQVGRSRPG